MKHPFLLQNFIEKNDNVKSYENKFAVVDLSKISSNKRQYIGFEQLLEIRGVLMVTRGEVNIVIDSIPYDLTENRILILEGQHIVSRVYFSDDCAGHCLIFDNDYLEMLVHEGKPPRELMTNIRLNPVIEFSNDDFAVLRGVIERIYADLIRSNHAFLSGIFDNALRIFNYELWNAILNNRRIKIDAETPYEQTAAQFIKLLHDNFRTRHELSFYAATLCVSTVFLTRAMK
ncbi:MAG: hypothetical protein LBN95_13015, partial [Prevotellaceae bacterium]|nr:hypothetical protein [Prevotellaceae bacterium]